MYLLKRPSLAHGPVVRIEWRNLGAASSPIQAVTMALAHYSE